MGSTPETQDNTHGAVPPPEDVPERPCLVLVFSSGTPRLTAFALDRGELEIGRAESGALTDGRLSRRHGRVRFDGARWHVTDLDSRNGTFLDGAPVRATVTHDAGRLRCYRLVHALRGAEFLRVTRGGATADERAESVRQARDAVERWLTRPPP